MTRLRDTEIAFTVARSRRRRTIGLKVGDEGLVVTLPSCLGLHHAERAVREKEAWVLDRLERAKARARPKLQGVDGEAIGWLGRELRLTVTGHGRARTVVERGPSRLEVRVDERLDEAMAYADQIGAKPPKVFIREQAARWGSCSQDGSIRMNARLVHFPEPLIDYVCAHEACHLKVMDHSQRFHALMEQIMPDCAARRRALKEAVAPGAAF